MVLIFSRLPEIAHRDIFMKVWHIAVLCILIGLLVSGLILIVARPVRGVPIVLVAAPTATTTSLPRPTSTQPFIKAQIGGEIASPGIYAIPFQSRLGDLILAAGGITSSADIIRINYAEIVKDGDYFYIPASDEEIPETAANAPSNFDSHTFTVNYPLNLNKATQEELETLPGIGPTKAADIVAYRERNEGFQSLEDLLEVPGIGETTFEAIREFLYIEP